jgi:hypothetical protein
MQGACTATHVASHYSAVFAALCCRVRSERLFAVGSESIITCKQCDLMCEIFILISSEACQPEMGQFEFIDYLSLIVSIAVFAGVCMQCTHYKVSHYPLWSRLDP